MKITTIPTTAPHPLLTPVQVSAILGITVESLAVWRCVGRYPGLRYIKVGRSVRYRPEDVEAFVASRTV